MEEQQKLQTKFLDNWSRLTETELKKNLEKEKPDLKRLEKERPIDPWYQQ